MSQQNITTLAQAFADAIPVNGPITLIPATNLEAYSAEVGATISSGGDYTVGVYITDTTALDPTGAMNVVGLFTPAFDAAASTLGTASVNVLETAPAMPENTSVFAVHAAGSPIAYLAIAYTEPAISLAGKYDPANVGRIHDVDLEVSVVIGSTVLPAGDILAWAPNTVVGLNTVVGDPAKILINGRHVADGTIVVQEQDYAVEVTRIVDRSVVR